MAHFFGCIALSGTIDLPQMAYRMEAGMDFFTPHATGTYLTDGVFIGNKILHNTPESVNTPLICQDDRYVLAASCRLDNRDTLAQTLQLPPNLSDHEYLLAAYRQFGEESPTYLLGDFSFVVWDKQEQRLFMAKDPLGIRPLFYLKTESLFVFSTAIHAIKALFDRPLPLNQTYLAYELKNYPVPVDLTFFADIYRLKPAHCRTFSRADGMQPERRYWELQSLDLSHLRTDADRLAELRRLFTEAVRCRVRTHRPVGCQLSGGMDSSAITVLAARLLGTSRLHTYSFVMNEKTRAYSATGIDEQATQHDIIEYAQLQRANHHPIEGFHFADVFEQLDHSNLIMGGHAYSNSIWQASLFRAAQRQGVGVMLSGFPGDECVSNSGGLYYFDYIHNRDWRGLLRFLKTNRLSGLKQIAGYYRAMYNGTYQRTYPAIQQQRNLLRADSPHHQHLRDTSFAFAHSFKDHLKDQICRAHTCLRTESEGAYALIYGIETAYPLADLRLIQFVYSLPAELFEPHPLPRMLFRRLCEGILPDSVRLQPKYSGAMTLAFAEYWMKQMAEELARYQPADSLNLFRSLEGYKAESPLIDLSLKMKLIDYLIELNTNPVTAHDLK